MSLDIKKIQEEYKKATKGREFKKYLFSILTFGLGALYLWLTTSIIKTGYIGIRRNFKGELVLLPPGRHSNFPWESYPEAPQSLSKKDIVLGPYKIITVETGFIAKTLKDGKLVILGEGRHMITDPCHVFDSFIAIKQQTKKLEAVSAYTKDSVGLTLHADVRYQIEKPEIAISSIDNIENSIKEIAEINISRIVSAHNLSDIAPVNNIQSVQANQAGGITELLSDLTQIITEQFSLLGIKLLNIGITSRTIKDQRLAHELAQGAVITSQTQSKFMAAKQEAEIKQINTDAEVRARLAIAKAEADAIQMKGDAINAISNSFNNNPAAQKIYDKLQEVELVSKANNPHLFFYSAESSNSKLPQNVIELSKVN